MPNYSTEVQKLENIAFLIIDAQEKIINPVKNIEVVKRNIKKILEAYEILGNVIYISEQNPKKLGRTISELTPKKEFKLIEKMSFSIARVPQFCEELISKGIKSLIICGFETHICVQQSVLDFLRQKFNVYIVVDAMGSRKTNDHNIAIERMISNGAVISSTESIIFEMCETSSRNEFKLISNIIKN